MSSLQMQSPSEGFSSSISSAHGPDHRSACLLEQADKQACQQKHTWQDRLLLQLTRNQVIHLHV